MTERQIRLTNNFDFLRMFAAVCILFSHCYALLKLEHLDMVMQISRQRYDASFIGLNIFFVISGYLITKSLYHSKSLKHYVWKRFLRIQPLLIVFTIITAFIIGPLFSSYSFAEYFSKGEVYTYLRNFFPPTRVQFTLPGVFSQNPLSGEVNGSLWTLVLEERLYILIGFLWFIAIPFRKGMALLALALNAAFIFFNAFLPNATNYVNSYEFYFIVVFITASALYSLEINFTKWAANNALLILLTCLWILCLLIPQLYVLCPLIYTLFMLVFAHKKLVLNYAGYYGDFTYGIYLFAFPVQQGIIALMGNNISPLILLMISLAIVVPMAILSWHLLEKRMLSLKNRVR